MRTLEHDDLVIVVDDPDDGRRRVADLTPEGRHEWHRLDRRSDEIASTLLETLSEAQRTDLTDALRCAERLIRLTSISLVRVDPASPPALVSLAQYYAELDRRFVGGFDVQAPAAGADDAKMRSPFGTFIVIDDGGESLGCGGLQRVDDRTAEIKRMWLHPSLRGLGLGKRLLERLERAAVELDYSVVVLDTNGALNEAISMYGSVGYTATERYNDNPYAHHWFRKEL